MKRFTFKTKILNDPTIEDHIDVVCLAVVSLEESPTGELVRYKDVDAEELTKEEKECISTALEVLEQYARFPLTEEEKGTILSVRKKLLGDGAVLNREL